MKPFNRKIRKLIIALLCPLLAWLQADAVTMADSVGFSTTHDYHINPYITALSVGTGAVAFGGIGRTVYNKAGGVIDTRSNGNRGTSVIQFAPLALPWVMKAAGVPTRSGWGRMAVSQGLGAAVMAGSVKLLKNSINTVRPDGSDTHSFPSGHTSWAFLGATITAHELANTSAWYPMGAYTVATAIAVERVLDRHHYPSDVMAGAGIGILSSELGYVLGDLMFGRSQLNVSVRDFRENSNFSFLSLSTGLNLPLDKIYAGGTEIERMPALSAALYGAWAFSEHWALGVEFGMVSTPLILNTDHYRTYVKSLTALGFTVMPQYVCMLSNRVSLTADAGVGYRKNLSLKVVDNAIRTCTGTPVGRVDIGRVMRFAPHFSAKASVGYEVSHYRFTVSPSTSFHTFENATTRGTTSSLLFALSSRYEF